MCRARKRGSPSSSSLTFLCSLLGHIPRPSHHFSLTSYVQTHSSTAPNCVCRRLSFFYFVFFFVVQEEGHSPDPRRLLSFSLSSRHWTSLSLSLSLLWRQNNLTRKLHIANLGRERWDEEEAEQLLAVRVRRARGIKLIGDWLTLLRLLLLFPLQADHRDWLQTVTWCQQHSRLNTQ